MNDNERRENKSNQSENNIKTETNKGTPISGEPQNTKHNMGERIGESIRVALKTGNLSELKNIGPAVSEAIKEVEVVISEIGENISGTAKTIKTSQTTKSNNAQANTPQTHRPAWMGNSAARMVNKLGPSKYSGMSSIVMGTITTVVSGVVCLVGAIFSAVGIAGVGFGMLAGFAVPALLGIGFIIAGNTKRKRAQRVRKYYEMLVENNNVCKITSIASASGWTPDAIRKDVRKCMQKGLMPKVQMDAEENHIMLGTEAYEQYLESEKKRLEAERHEASEAERLNDPMQAALDKFEQESKITIQRIHFANEAIHGEAMSSKLETLETTATKIFEYVKAHPKKLPDTRRYVEYYLPTVLKIVEKYKQYDENAAQVKSVIKAKREIEEMMDKINHAFENLLNEFYKDDTLDVSTDMEVLQTVLTQEGLMGKEFKIEADAEELKL